MTLLGLTLLLIGNDMTFTSAAVVTLRSMLAAQADHAARIERSLEVARTFDLSIETFRSTSADADELFAIATILRDGLQTLGGYNADAKRDFGIISDLQDYAWGSYTLKSDPLWIPEEA